jgi:hypothetical protein
MLSKGFGVQATVSSIEEDGNLLFLQVALCGDEATRIAAFFELCNEQ